MKHLLIFTILSVFFTACAAPAVARLQPEAEEFSYRNGEKLVTKTDGEAKVTVSYYDSSPKYVVFHMEVENVGTLPFDFDPVVCLLIGDFGPVRQAIDPEVQLLSMDLESVNEPRSIRLFELTNLALTVAGVAIAATEGVTDPTFYAGAGLNTAVDLSVLLSDDGEEVAIARGVAAPLGGIEPKPDNRFFWLDHALRITTIQPGERVFGKIAFARNDEAKNLLFKVAVQEQEFSFSFSQMLLSGKQ